MLRAVLVTIAAALVWAPALVAQITPQEEEEVLLTFEQSRVATVTSVVEDVVALSPTCKQATRKQTGETLFGIDLWWIKQRLAWCWVQRPSGAVITSGPWWTPACGGSTYKILASGFHWDFKGWVDCRPAGGVGQTYVRRWRKGHFQLCNPALGCIQNLFPYAWVRGNAGGTYSTGGGGT